MIVIYPPLDDDQITWEWMVELFNSSKIQHNFKPQGVVVAEDGLINWDFSTNLNYLSGFVF